MVTISGNNNLLCCHGNYMTPVATLLLTELEMYGYESPDQKCSVVYFNQIAMFQPDKAHMPYIPEGLLFKGTLTPN